MRHFPAILLVTTGVGLGSGFSVARAADPVSASSPSAAPQAVAVLAMRSDGVDDQADALLGALRASVRANPRLTLAEGDYSIEVLSLALHCGDTPDPACLARISKEIHSERYVWGVLRRVKGEKKVRAELHYWERGQTSHYADATYPDNLTVATDASLRTVADGLIKTVLSGQTNEPPASSPTSPAPAAVAAAGRAPLARDAAARPATEAESDESHPDNDSARRAVGWAGIGLGAAMLGASAFSAYRVHAIGTDDAFEQYRQGFHSGEDVCQEASLGHPSSLAGALTPAQAHDSCSQASTFQTLEFVFLGLGVVTAGAGVYFLATSRSQPPPATVTWQLRPRIGPTAAALDLAITGF